MSKQISKSYLRNISKYLDGKNYFETFIKNDEKCIRFLKSQLKRELDLSKNLSLDEILNILYDFVSDKYPNDVIYKINFLENIENFVGVPSKSYVVNEFKFGRNITDLAVFNGESICFEIKSDLDRANNISKQFKYYEEIFDYCYLVTGVNRVEELKSKLTDNSGIIVLDKNESFSIKRSAQKNNNISFEKLFRILRKNEYLKIVRFFYDEVPTVPNTKIFSESFNLLKKIKFENFKAEFLKQIKSRNYSVNITDLRKIKKNRRQGFLANR